MASFRYIALNQDQKELSGVIEAPDEARARDKLNELGLSVVSLVVFAASNIPGTALPEAKPGLTSLPIFEFEALDVNNKKISGTISAHDLVKAYGRLTTEYQLGLIALVRAEATQEQKERAKAAGLGDIKEKYEKLYGIKIKKLEKEEEGDSSLLLQKKRKELFDIVDFTTSRIERFLQLYGADLKVEERHTLQGYLNQLVRIHTSTNLDHIRGTCERMLMHIQEQELFLHEEQKLKESTELKTETKELLSQLKRTGLNKNIDILGSLRGLKNIKFLSPLSGFLERLLPETPPELKKLEEEKRGLNRQLLAYLKMVIFTKSAVVRAEAMSSIKTISEEKKRLKLKIHALKESLQMQSTPQAETYLLPHLRYFFGWLLTFHLIFYLLSYPFTMKQFGSFIPPQVVYFYSSSFTKAFTLFIFFFYAALSLHEFWLSKKAFAGIVLYPMTLVAFLFLAINLF